MDFFAVSKLAWLVVDPGNLIVLVLLSAVVLGRMGYRVAARVLSGAMLALLLMLVVLPIDQFVARPLEDRFPHPDLPACIAGILVLGGGEMPVITGSRGVPAVRAAGRYIAVADLARRYPSARIMFSGGSGDLFRQTATEDLTAKQVFEELGLDPARITYEGRSRTTWENLQFSKALMNPKAGERWILVTAALHMPRSIGIADRLGWTMLPWATDYETADSLTRPAFSLASSLTVVDAAGREWLGLAVYHVLGRTQAWFPAPAPSSNGGDCGTASG
jgi:uncharacterized SAM-binding protein YcdF (DUF218 family)